MKIFRLLWIICFVIPLQAQVTITNIDSAMAVLRSSPEDTSKAILYQKVAGHYNVTALDSAKAFAEQGLALSENLDYDLGRWTNLNTLANYYERKTSYDSAMIYYNRALEIVEANNSTKGFAVVLNNIATVHIRRGEYDTALEYLFDALKAEEKLGNRNGIAQAYNNIGVVYYYSQQFDKTTDYLTRALEIQEELGNFDGLINGYNNVGAIYDYLQQYDDAITSYTKGLEIARKIEDRKMEATQLSNIAIAYSNKEDFSRAEDYFNQSIEIREIIDDDYGRANSFLGFGQMFLSKKNYDKAEQYVKRSLEISRANDIKLVEKEGVAAMVDLAEARGDYQQANELLYEYIAVKDTLLNRENSKTMLELDTKYQTEKKEKEILQQRAELAEKELQVKRKNNLIYGSLGLAILLGLLGYLVYNRQKLKNDQLKKEAELKTALARIETQNRLQEQRLRISRDLHDNIGSQLTFIISSLDNLTFGLKDKDSATTNRIQRISGFTSQTIYELRDTIWAMNKGSINVEDLQARISNFIDQARAANEKLQFEFKVSEEVPENSSFSSIVGMNAYRIIQEAVNNALKYAEASQIVVSVDEKEGSLAIAIKDHGKGFDLKQAELGNGLNNMKKRARDIGSELVIETQVGEGTSIGFTMPA
ncbi:sensor histidine kinase [Aureitalea marina]|uniref:Histidine kinase domain-containing protein n=1 Tax=Aureitalea marina TaxID=930804 RepID=A0A2S7KLZ2_9FLAO|nr:sensor histidine kinase [Aureitalea marina]PQB03622.1 hypothetical protein BST85_00935 [Aureitalea marina]